jgi:predicted unusual protein kinase regulating ubiquinone biosynthesis (AarF/ABC1/UbiB family)
MGGLLSSIMGGLLSSIAESMLKVGITRDKVDIDKLTKDITELFKSLNEVDPEKLLSNISKNKSDGINDMIVKIGEIGKNYGIRFPRAFTMLLKQFMYFDRYMQMLEPNASVFDDDRIQMHPGLM